MLIVFGMFVDSSYENEYSNLIEPTLVMRYIKPVTVETVIEDYRDSINLFLSVFFFGLIIHIILMIYLDRLNEVVQRSFSNIKKMIPVYSLSYLFIWPLIFIFFRLLYVEDKIMETIEMYISIFMLYFIIFFFLFLVCTSYLFPHLSIQRSDLDTIVGHQNDNRTFTRLVKVLVLCSIAGLFVLQFGTEIIKDGQSELFVCFIICLFWFVTYNITMLAECNPEKFTDDKKRILLDEPKKIITGLNDVD